MHVWMSRLEEGKVNGGEIITVKESLTALAAFHRASDISVRSTFEKNNHGSFRIEPNSNLERV